MKLPAEDCSGKDKGKVGLLKKSKYGARDAASNWDETGKGISKIGVTKKLFPQHEKENFGLDTRRRLWGDGNEGESVGAQEAAGERVPSW